jgi:hypothetical protein
VNALRILLLLIHLGGMALLLGGFALATMAGQRRIPPAIFHGASIQLVTGLLLVAVNSADDRDLNHAKIAVKLTVAVVVAGLTHANRRRDPVPAGVFYGAFALAALNAIVAYSWH